MTTKRFNTAAGSDPAEKWYGVYLGKVTNTRQKDVWVRVQVPQIMGETISNWARPMGFNVVGQVGGQATYVSDVTADTPNLPGSHFGQFVPVPMGPGRAIGYTPHETAGGPGPPIGTIVLIMFVGGDRNFPAYMLTSQTV